MSNNPNPSRRDLTVAVALVAVVLDQGLRDGVAVCGELFLRTSDPRWLDVSIPIRDAMTRLRNRVNGCAASSPRIERDSLPASVAAGFYAQLRAHAGYSDECFRRSGDPMWQEVSICLYEAISKLYRLTVNPSGEPERSRSAPSVN